MEEDRDSSAEIAALQRWAGGWAPVLAERAREAEALRRLPEATVAEAEAAGLFRMLVPSSRGGMGAGFPAFLDVVRQMSVGCTSSGWTLSFLALHAWLLCRFEAELQEELFANGRMPLVPAPLAPTGTAEKVEGGYRISGRWEWATGVMHADWVMVNCMEPGGMGPRFCVLPLADVAVEDVWHTAGMAATGSNVVTAAGVFVPEHRTLAGWRIVMGRAPGETLHPGTSVNYPMSATLALVAATPALGAAEGALAAFQARMLAKMQAYSGAKQSDVPSTHLRLGEATALVRAIRLVWADAIARLERIGPHGAAAPVEERAAIRLASAQIVRLANDAIDLLAASAGASSGFLASPLQRQLRDVQMMRGHVVFDWDRAAQVAGRVALGLETTPADLI